MTNSVISPTAHAQRRSNRKSRKRKRLAEITESSKPSKHVLADATSSKRRQLYSLIPTPPLTEELTAKKAADTVSHSEHYNCDHIWDLIRELKAKQYTSNLCLTNLCPATMDAKDDFTIITTTTQPRKEQQRYAEEMLHPRWIAIKRKKDRIAKPLLEIQTCVRKALREGQSPDFKSTIEDELFASISDKHRVLIKSRLKDLKESRASELQWEARLWRRWFLKDSLRDLDGDPSDSEPFMGQIVQAKMSLSGDGGVLPPLLASSNDRRESRLVVASVPWAPDLIKQKGNHILWYPDYLYAVSLSSLRRQIPDFDVDELPAFRLAQYKYLPGNWIAEIKSEDTQANHLAAEQYSAFISAYLLHERLLLHWIAKNESIESNNPVEFNDNLAIHCITCCGSVCKIWRMSVRANTGLDHEPIRYDMQILDTLDLETDNRDQRLCDWINAFNALALTVQFKDIITDLQGIQANESLLSSANKSRLSPTIPHTYSWTSKVGFVYNAGSATEICVAPLSDLRKAYKNGEIKADEQIGDKVIEWDEKGQPLEVDITGKGEQVPKPGASPILPGASITLSSTSSALPDAPSALPGASSAIPGASSTLPSAPSVGSVQTRFTEAELRRLSSPVVERIAKALSRANSGDDIGSTRKEHTRYITEARQASDAGGMRMDIWKKMKLSKGDLDKLRVDTLRTIISSIGARDPGSTATKKALVRVLQTC